MTNQISSVADVLETLQLLKAQLPNCKLSQLTVFNTAYWVVTKTIQAAAEDGYFRDPVFMERLSVCFAKYYFQIINDAGKRNATLPAAWQNLIAGNTKRPVSVSLLLGANAHINYDLPLALLDIMGDVMGKGVSRKLLKDVLKVDKLLVKSGREIIGTFDEPNHVLDVIKRHGRWLYFWPTMHLVLYWRLLAWRSYLSIKKRGVAGSNFEQKSSRIAKRLDSLGRWIGFFS